MIKISKDIEETKRKFVELQNASKQLVEYLQKNYDPHTVVMVDQFRVTLLQEQIGINTNQKFKE